MKLDICTNIEKKYSAFDIKETEYHSNSSKIPYYRLTCIFFIPYRHMNNNYFTNKTIIDQIRLVKLIPYCHTNLNTFSIGDVWYIVGQLRKNGRIILRKCTLLI